MYRPVRVMAPRTSEHRVGVTRRLAWRIAVPVVLGVLVATAGCGSGGSSGNQAATRSPSPSPTVGRAGHLEPAPEPTASPRFPDPKTDAGRRQLLSAVFTDTQSMWSHIFEASGARYRKAKLTFFSGAVETGCGSASSQVGPFYCPADDGVYLDTSFFTTMQQKFGIQGGLPPAYVVGHEMGHHVQNLTGTLAKVHAAQQQAPDQANALSVRQELQADCYAGVWIHATYSRDLLGSEDLNDALHAATVIADDFQQRKATGTVKPDEWTHGSSAQRRHWLAVGFTDGDPDRCDTFTGD